MRAILLEDIRLEFYNQVLKVGETIVVDPFENIGIKDEMCFDLETWEYSIIH